MVTIEVVEWSRDRSVFATVGAIVSGVHRRMLRLESEHRESRSGAGDNVRAHWGRRYGDRLSRSQVGLATTADLTRLYVVLLVLCEAPTSWFSPQAGAAPVGPNSPPTCLPPVYARTRPR